jgi:hypothetical protein
MLNPVDEATREAFDATLLAQVQGHIEHGLELPDAVFDRVADDPMMLVHVTLLAGLMRARVWVKGPPRAPDWRLPIRRAEALARRLAVHLTITLAYWQAEAFRLNEELQEAKEERHADYW